MDLKKIRDDFPALQLLVNEKLLIYLDNAATTHKPQSVMERMNQYNREQHANPHRGAHHLSVKATEAYERSRSRVKEFIGAKNTKEIIFTKNTTESLNLLAYTYGMNFIEAGDEIVLTISEHHSNILPWQQVARLKGAILKYMYVDEMGRIPREEIKDKITDKTKLVSVAHMSNALGVIHPVKEIIHHAHNKGAVVIVDGAQSAPHIKTDVKELDADFYVFSGHKMLGPMGIGVLYGKENLLEKMPPFLTGGDMIEYVEEQDATFAPLPYKFEAGTQNVEGAVGLEAAIDYIEAIGLENIKQQEKNLTDYALKGLKSIPYVDIYGPQDTQDRGGVISFNIKDVHPHDVASIVDVDGVAIRSGHHCAQPLMKYLNIPATCRVSFYFYNTKEEVDSFIKSIKNVRKWLGYGS